MHLAPTPHTPPPGAETKPRRTAFQAGELTLRHALYVAAAACLLALVLHGLGLGGEFVSDDGAYVEKNDKLRSLAFGELWRVFVEPHTPVELLPIRDLSYWIDMQLFGKDPRGFRAHNILLHIVLGGIVFGATRRIWQVLGQASAGRANGVAAITTAVFMLHPAHVESVVWISGRKDLLSALFSAAALWLAVEAGPAARRLPAFTAAITVAVVLAIMSKAAAIAILPAIAAVALFHALKNPQASLPAYGALAVVPAVTALVVFTQFLRASTISVPQYWGPELLTRFLAIEGWVARLLVTPETRLLVYPVAERGFVLMAAVGAIAVLGCAVALWVAYRRRSPAWLAFLLMLTLPLPYTQLVPFGSFSLVSDRYLLLTSWGFAMALAALAVTRYRVAAIGIALIVWATQTGLRTQDWQDFDTLLGHDVAQVPGHYQARANIALNAGGTTAALALAQEIDDPAIRDFVHRLVDIEREISTSAPGQEDLRSLMGKLWQVGQRVKVNPPEAAWNMALGHVYSLGRMKTTGLWGTLSERHPQDAVLNYNAGLWHISVDWPTKATTFLERAKKAFDPQSAYYASAMKNLGVALLAAGRYDEAERELLGALQAPVPAREAHCALENLYGLQDRPEQADAAANCAAVRASGS